MNNGDLKDMLQLMSEKNQAYNIINGIGNDGNVLIFASDGSGVRSVNQLLSDDQLGEINGILIGYLSQLISDIDQELEDCYFEQCMNPPEEEDESEFKEED